jgi:hypothetical protein
VESGTDRSQRPAVLFQQSAPIAAVLSFRPRDTHISWLEIAATKMQANFLAASANRTHGCTDEQHDPGCFIQDITTGHPSTSRIYP